MERLTVKNVRCWFFGHTKSTRFGTPVLRKLKHSDVFKLVRLHEYFCEACDTKEEYPDIRNLYRRTIPVWCMQLRNRFYSWRMRRREPQRLAELKERLENYKYE